MTPPQKRATPASSIGNRKRGLTRELVLETALSLVDANGLGTLTMRGLAAALDVEAMSLYNHVRDKQDLINGMNVLVLSRLDRDTDATEWPEVLAVFARRFYEAYLPRPDLARALERTVPTSPEAFGAMERALAALEQTGLDPSAQVSAFRGVIAVCLGFVLVHGGEPMAPRMPGARPWSGWDQPTMAGSTLEHVVRLAPAFDTTSNEEDFDFVIGACIEALRSKARAAERARALRTSIRTNPRASNAT